MSPEIQARAQKIKLLLLDVDGVLSDGKIYFDHNGVESKSFNTLDGHGIKMLQKHGVKVGIITGRKSHIVERRAEDLGITVALVPTDLPGVDTGDRHIPAGLAFQNGPSWGRDVFIPVNHILGGQEQTGQGWKMLMGALAAGRGISLPSLSTAAAQVSAQSTGAYARIREQFGIHIGKFEGVQEKLAPIGAIAYQLEAARRFITIGLDNGHHPGVASGIMKYHATERMRETINHAMDVHGGKSICVGPKNYLETPYRAIPIGITVEGANILTRSLIIFGQGSNSGPSRSS